MGVYIHCAYQSKCICCVCQYECINDARSYHNKIHCARFIHALIPKLQYCAKYMCVLNSHHLSSIDSRHLYSCARFLEGLIIIIVMYGHVANIIM